METKQESRESILNLVALKYNRSFFTACENAKRFAAEGPRVAAVIADRRSGKLKYSAAPGFMDYSQPKLEQVVLFTPDGQEWRKWSPK